ncbi:hypothetical protein QL285_057192 [Trifolium repens]|nr:hypothetical protein QL285_057192 [Trifolium repens]
MRSAWGERDFGRVPQTGGDEDEWTVVRPRSRKSRRQNDGGFDRLRFIRRYSSGRTISRSRVSVSSRTQQGYSHLGRDRTCLGRYQSYFPVAGSRNSRRPCFIDHHRQAFMLSNSDRQQQEGGRRLSRRGVDGGDTIAGRR